MTISLIVAASTNNAIGKNNKLLWHLPNDLTFFKNTTWGMPVIMGRKTFESMNKPLPGRFNYVITRQSNWNAKGVTVANDLTEALKKAEEPNCNEIFIIGGGEVFKQSMDLANKIYLTRVHANLEGDVFFPEIDESAWELLSSTDLNADDKHAFDYSFQVWVKKS